MEEAGCSKATPQIEGGLLHNLGAGCKASFIKGIRLGRPDHFLAISYTAKHMDPGLGSSVRQTHYKLSPDCSKEANRSFAKVSK